MYVWTASPGSGMDSDLGAFSHDPADGRRVVWDLIYNAAFEMAGVEIQTHVLWVSRADHLGQNR